MTVFHGFFFKWELRKRKKNRARACFVSFICFVQLIKRGANCSKADKSKQKIVDKNIRNYNSRFANCRRHVTGISQLPVQLMRLGTKVTFAMTCLTIWARSWVCPDVYRATRFVAHEYLRTLMHSFLLLPFWILTSECLFLINIALTRECNSTLNFAKTHHFICKSPELTLICSWQDGLIPK